MESFKQVVVLRSDLGMSTGKKISQACHASLGAYEKADESNVKSWREQGMKKVVLKVEGEKELVEVFRSAKDMGLPAYLVRDAGKTEISQGSKTCLGLGPAEASRIDTVTGELDVM